MVVPEDLVDDPDPEPRPALQHRVARRRAARATLRSARAPADLGAALGEEAGVQRAAFGFEPRLRAVEFAAGRLPPGRSGEQRLLVQEVGAQQRVVAGELEGFLPATFAAEPGDVGAHARQPRSRSDWPSTRNAVAKSVRRYSRTLRSAIHSRSCASFSAIDVS